MVTTAKPADSTHTTDATTTATTKNPFEVPSFGVPSLEVPSIEEVTQQMHDLNERMIESTKGAALSALDAFEKALESVGDLEQKAAAATKLDWVSAAATTHAKFMADVSAPYNKAVRDLLK